MNCKRIVERIAEELSLIVTAGDVPTRVARIGFELNLFIIPVAHHDAPSAALVRHPGRRGGFIFIRQYDGLPRQRFSVAHEIGEYLLGDDERAANYFAACLLMPRRHFEATWHTYRHEPLKWRLRLMAAAFVVSPAAAAIRAEELRLALAREPNYG